MGQESTGGQRQSTLGGTSHPERGNIIPPTATINSTINLINEKKIALHKLRQSSFYMFGFEN